MSDTTRGIIAALGAYVIWGTSPIFWKMLAHVPPVEVFAHRTFWGAVIFGLMIAAQGRLGELRNLLAKPASRLLVVGAAMMVSVNWGLYIWSIQVDRLIEASIGYYIFPLIAVALGVTFFGEKMSGAQMVAIALAVIAVGYLTWSLGVAPWISLVLATSFGFYGLLKKQLDSGPTLSVTAELVLIAPLSLVWILGVHEFGWKDFTGRLGGHFLTDPQTTLLLIASGAVTALPLILFSSASRKISYATVGVLQYLNPTLQFLLAVLLFAEPLTSGHIVALPLIWLALAVYTGSLIYRERAA